MWLSASSVRNATRRLIKFEDRRVRVKKYKSSQRAIDVLLEAQGTFPGTGPEAPSDATLASTFKPANFRDSFPGPEIGRTLVRAQRKHADGQHTLAFALGLEVHDARFEKIV